MRAIPVKTIGDVDRPGHSEGLAGMTHWIQELRADVDGHAFIQLLAVAIPEGQSPAVEAVVVGTAAIHFVQTDAPVFSDLYVHPLARRCGLGEDLTVAAMNWADTHETPLYLHVQPSNDAALGLYHKLGWKPMGGVHFKDTIDEQGRGWLVWCPPEIVKDTGPEELPSDYTDDTPEQTARSNE